MNAIKSRLSWKRVLVLCGLLLLVPAALLFAAPAPPDPAVVSFDYSSWTVNQSDGTATVTITMTGTPTDVVSVMVSTDTTGTATPQVDFVPNQQQLVWQPTDAGTSQSFTIQILNNYAVGPALTVGLNLSQLSSNAIYGNPTAVLYILNDSQACPPPP